MALTDHGVMYGAMEFYYAARDTRLTPIIGCEAYIAPRGRFDRTVRDEAHVTLLAADLIGYRNLTALISKGFLEGYYYKPRIDLDLLAQHHDGLIVLSGCMSGMVAAPLLKNDYETAVKNAKTYVDIFGDRFYIEVMRHGMPEEDVINTGLVKVARATGCADRRDQRLALSRSARCARARRVALHRHRQDRLGYQPDEVLLRSVLRQIRRRDVRTVERSARSLREHGQDRQSRRYQDSREDLSSAAVSRAARNARSPRAQCRRILARDLRSGADRPLRCRTRHERCRAARRGSITNSTSSTRWVLPRTSLSSGISSSTRAITTFRSVRAAVRPSARWLRIV